MAQPEGLRGSLQPEAAAPVREAWPATRLAALGRACMPAGRHIEMVSQLTVGTFLQHKARCLQDCHRIFPRRP